MDEFFAFFFFEKNEMLGEKGKKARARKKYVGENIERTSV